MTSNETMWPLRAYFALAGIILVLFYGPNLADMMTLTTIRTPELMLVFFESLSMLVGLVWLYFALALPRLLRTAPTVVSTVVMIGTGLQVTALGLTLLGSRYLSCTFNIEVQGRHLPLVVMLQGAGLAICFFLLNSVERLAQKG